MRIIYFLAVCLWPFTTEAALEMSCLTQLPKSFQTAPNTPRSFQFSQQKEVSDYENQPAGAGWGCSVKYRNVYCESLIYLYTLGKTKISMADVETELNSFDGFKPTYFFEQQFNETSFLGAAGTLKPENADEQIQLVALSHLQNHFLKYRLSCRKTEGLDNKTEFRLIESFLSDIIKNSLEQISVCLSKSQ